MDMEHERRLTEVEERCKSNSHRLNAVEKRQDNLDKLVTTVNVLATREENIENTVDEVRCDVKTLINKPAKRWDGMIDKIIMTIAATIIGFILAKVGL